MKTKTKVIIAAFILLAAGIILLISTIFKPSGGNLLTGTFGKADKYRQQTMTDKDVQLRSQFVEDSVQLRKMIQGLKYFAEFNEKVAWQIDTMMYFLRDHPLISDPAINPPFIALKDYSAFLSGNCKNINTTEAMLQHFYSGKEADASFDVEKNLRDFGTFLNQVALRDSVLENAARCIDMYLDKASKKKPMDRDNRYLNAFRDQLLVDNLLTAALLGEKNTLARLAKYVKDEDQSADLFASLGDLKVSPVFYSTGPLSVVEITEAVSTLDFVDFVEAIQTLDSRPDEIFGVGQIGVTEIYGCTAPLDPVMPPKPLNFVDVVEGVSTIKYQLIEGACLTALDHD